MKQAFYFFLFCLFINFVNAQSLGIKGGLNMANIDFANKDYKTNRLFGFHAGILANYKLSPRFGLQVEALYSKEGANSTYIPSGEGYTGNTTFLQLPLMIQYRIMTGLQLAAGPQPGIPLAINETDERTGTTQDLRKSYKPIDLRWAFAVGHHLAQVPGLGINARYSFSLRSFNEGNVNGTSVKNSLFEIGLFYVLGKDAGE